MRTAVFFIAFLSFANCCAAQLKDFKFQHFTQEDGLPSNESYFVYRDSKNYLWVATDQGVVRFNGARMEHFDLPDNVIFKIREDSKGRVWFFSHTGKLAYFFKEKIYPFERNDSIEKNISNLLITNAFVDDNDVIHLNTAGNINYKILPEGHVQKVTVFTDDFNNPTVLNIYNAGRGDLFVDRLVYQLSGHKMEINLKTGETNRSVNYSMPLRMENFSHVGAVFNENYFVFAGKTLVRLNSDGTTLVKILPADILSMCASGNGVWVGMIKSGAMFLTKDLEETEPEPVLKGISITSVALDHEGGTWFSTLEKGVFYLKSNHVYTLKGDAALSQPISRLCNIGDSILLFATGQGIHKWKNDAVTTIFKRENDNIADILPGNKRIIVAGKWRVNDMEAGAYEFGKSPDRELKDFIFLQSSVELGQDATGRINTAWGPMLVRVNTEKATEFNRLDSNIYKNREMPILSTFFFTDSEKRNWIGSTDGVYLSDPAMDTVYKYQPADSLFPKVITGMRQVSNGIYAVGVRFGGVAFIKDGRFIASITTNEGLLSNAVKYMLHIGNQLWIATPLGISVITFTSWSPISYKINNIGKNEGFNNLLIKQLLPFKGNVLAATSDGLYVVDRSTGDQSREKVPLLPFYIRSINYFDGDTIGINSITVPYSKNRLKIQFNAICFNTPGEVSYYYRFENSDSSWQKINGTELLLENLSPGTYDLEMRAAIVNQRRYSEIQKFNINIEKPWWQNNWLKVAAIALLIFIGILFYKIRVKQITKKAATQTQLQTRMLELEQTALRSQMNPHFIFNSLTSIQQSIIGGKSLEANEHLVKFARLIRKTLEISARPYIRIAEEEQYLSEYLYLEQLRIPGEFDYRIEVDPAIDRDKTEIPNMMLQPIVENSIRHGIKHLQHRKGMILVTMKLQENFIACTVSDNGVGRNSSDKKAGNIFTQQKSYGMEIVRKRLELQPGKENIPLPLEIKDLLNADGTAAGTEVTIHLPFKMTNA